MMDKFTSATDQQPETLNRTCHGNAGHVPQAVGAWCPIGMLVSAGLTLATKIRLDDCRSSGHAQEEPVDA